MRDRGQCVEVYHPIVLSLNRNFLKSVVLSYRIFCFDIVLPFFIFFFFIISMSITINLKID